MIESLNGGKNSRDLGNWLAEEFELMYGDLAGKTNKDVAKYFGKLFKASKRSGRHGKRHDSQSNDLRDLNAQVMAAALAVYVTDLDLAGTAARSYGFLVTAGGAGAAMFNVGDAGEAFDLLDGESRVMSVWDILQATNDRTVDGDLYGMDAMVQALADKVYTMINEIGGID